MKRWEAERNKSFSNKLPLFKNSFPPLPEVKDFDEQTKIEHEIQIYGFPIIRHPLSLYQKRIAGIQPIKAKELKKYVGQSVTMVGWLITGKLVSTQKNEPMAFFSFEDQTALYETTFFPDTYKRFCHLMINKRPYILKGKVESDFGVATLNVSQVRYL